VKCWTADTGAVNGSTAAIGLADLLECSCLLTAAADSFHTAVTAEALRGKIDNKSAILHQRGHFDPKFQVQGPIVQGTMVQGLL